jgi:hypothetical protein
MRARLALIAALLAVGCYHDKFNMTPRKKEEYLIPPDEDRYNLPETAPYKPPPAPKEQPTLMGGNGPGGSGSGSKLGGF